MVAGFGVAVRDWISYFRHYLNVQPSLDLFRRIRTDHVSDEQMTSLERERRGPVRPLWCANDCWNIGKSISSLRVAVFSEHPFLDAYLGRQRRAQTAASC